MWYLHTFEHFNALKRAYNSLLIMFICDALRRHYCLTVDALRRRINIYLYEYIQNNTSGTRPQKL